MFLKEFREFMFLLSNKYSNAKVYLRKIRIKKQLLRFSCAFLVRKGLNNKFPKFPINFKFIFESFMEQKSTGKSE